MPSDEALGSQTSPAPSSSTSYPSGLGGWLVLPIIGLFVNIIGSTAAMFTYIIPAFQSGGWSVLTNRGSELYHPLWEPTLIFEAFLNAVLIVFPIVLLVLLFRKRRILPKLIIGFYVFVIVAVLVDAIAMATFAISAMREAGFPEAARETAVQSIWGLVKATVLAAVWIPYFSFSKRVKKTFVRGASPTAQAHLDTAAPQVLPVTPADSSVLATPGTLASVESAPETTAPRATPTTRSRLAVVWILTALPLLALTILGVLIWRNATLSDELDQLVTVHGNTKTYTDPDYAYTFDYPADWMLQKSIIGVDASAYNAPGTVVVFGPYGTAATGGYGLDMMGVTVEPLPLAVDESDLPDIKANLEAYLAEFPSSVPTAEVTDPASACTVGGLSGFKATLTESLEGTRITTTLYWLYAENLCYTLMLQAKTANEWALDDDFAAFIASFKPGPEQ